MSGGEDNIQGYMLAIQQLRLCAFFFFKDLGNASLAATLVIIHVIAYKGPLLVTVFFSFL